MRNAARTAETRPKPFKLVPDDVPEDVDQTNLAKWLDAKQLAWCHVPNGGARDAVTGARLKAHGVKPGVPDVLVFCPPPNHPGKVGTAVELKKKHGGVVSEYQERWLNLLESRNWLVTVAKGWEAAVKFLTEAGY